MALFCAFGEAAFLGSDRNKVEPSVTAGDSKFFGKDYPYDSRPATGKDFSFKHPYPIVQDSEDYSKDYTKDENGDGGQWDAQMTYDEIRSKLRKYQKELDAAKATEKYKKEAYEDALEEKSTAYREASDAKTKKQISEKTKKDSESKVEEVKKKGQASGDSSDVDTESGAKQVDKEESDLEECQKQLKKARKDLKDALEERERATGKKGSADADAASKLEAARKAEDEEELLEGTVEKEKKDYKEAVAFYEKKVAELERAEQRLQATEGKVRSIRDSADADGGVYPVHREKSAARESLSFEPFLALLVLLSVHMAS